MARDARLRLAEDVGQILDRQFGLGQQRQDAQARRLAGRLQRGIEGVEAELGACRVIGVVSMGLFPLYKDIFIR